MSVKIQIRRGTAAQWTSANTILAQGEMGLETDTLKTKFGDGATAWNLLPYSVTKSQLLLDQVDNTSDLNKPISTLTQSALNSETSRAQAAEVALASNISSEIARAESVEVSLASAISTKVTSNSPISAGTATKVSFDQKGLITSAADALLNDLADVVVSSPLVNQILSYNGTNWVNSSGAVVNAGPGVSFFLSQTSSGINGYHYISKTPDSASEVNEYATVNDSTVLVDSYISNVPFNKTTIDAGIWEFNYFSYVSNNHAHFITEVYKRTSGGVETLLFSVESELVNWTSVDLINVTSVQPEFSCNASDVLVVKIYATTTETTNVTLHLIHSGADHYSHFRTPLVLNHNDIAGLQGGTSNQYYHLTQAEYSGIGAGNFVRESALSSEESTRASADASLASSISSAESSRVAADSSLTSRISSEESARASSETSLDSKISSETSRASSVEATKANLSGGNTFAGKQIMTASSSLTGVNVGSFTGDPTTLVSGDIWVNSATNEFNFRRDTVTLPLRSRLNTQVITTGTTYTPTAGTKYIYATLIGAGGGGGGVSGAGTSVGIGAGGGAGAELRAYTALTGAASYTVAIGTGGTAGANTGGTGGTGGSTTLTVGATTYTVAGGVGGVGQAAGTAEAFLAGGAGAALPTGGLINIAGGKGGFAHRRSGTLGHSGAGGNTSLGQGGGNLVAAGAGEAGRGYGSGGGGAMSTSTATLNVGGVGAGGIIIIEEYA